MTGSTLYNLGVARRCRRWLMELTNLPQGTRIVNAHGLPRFRCTARKGSRLPELTMWVVH